MASSVKLTRIHLFTALHHRNYRLLWGASFLNGLAHWMQNITVAWLAWELSSSPLTVAIVIGTRYIPFLIIGPFIGVLIDRLNRRILLIADHLFLSVASFAFASMIPSGTVQIWHVVTFMIITGICWSSMNPLRQTLIANTVPKKDLMNAIALRSLGFNVTRMLGPAIGGILIQTQGLHINLIIQGTACMLGMLLLIPLKMPYKEMSPPHNAFMADFRQGINYLIDQPVLFRLLIMTLASTAFILPLKNMMPVVAATMFDGGAITAGFLTSSLGVGALIGSVVIAQSSKLKRKFIVALLCLIMSGCVMILFAQSHWLPVSVCLATLFGLSHMIFGLINNTLVQSLVPDHLRGRISSLYMAETGIVPAGIILLGWLMSSIGPTTAVSILGTGTIISSLLITKLKKISHPDEV